jgi:hypothetical protein
MLGITASDDPAAEFMSNKGTGKKCMLLLRIYLGDDKNLVLATSVCGLQLLVYAALSY